MSTYTFSFRVRGGDFDPDTLESEIELRPRYKRKAGSAILDSSGMQLGVEARNYWSYTPPQLEADNLIGEIERLVTHLEGRRFIIDGLISQGSKCEFFVGLKAVGYTGEEFPSSLLLRLGKMSVGLSLDCQLSVPRSESVEDKTGIRGTA